MDHATENILIKSFLVSAGGQGIEPRFLGPKPSVLPLDDPPSCAGGLYYTEDARPTLTNEDSYGNWFTYVVRMQSKRALLTVR